MTELTQARLKKLLHYEPETGVFTWKVRPSLKSRRRAGDVAGCRWNKPPRRVIGIDGTNYLAYRLAFLFMTGEFPLLGVDHKDTDPSNDAWDNLREASDEINQQNRRRPSKKNRCGLLGVSKKRNGYCAQISIDKKQTYIGTFDTPELAHAAYVAAKRIHHPGCTL